PSPEVPSPFVQWIEVWKRPPFRHRWVASAVQVTAPGATVTCRVIAFDPLRLPAVSWTVKLWALENVWLAVCVIAVVPSPESQFQPVAPPVEVSVNVTGEPDVGCAGA